MDRAAEATNSGLAMPDCRGTTYPTIDTTDCGFAITQADDLLRVFVLSDVRLYSDGLAALLASDPTIAVVGAAAVSEPARNRILAVPPDVLIIDAPSFHRTDFVHRVVAELPSLLVVVCGVSEHADEVIACAQEGAAGYIHRDATAEELIRTVKSVKRGELPCSPHIASLLFRKMASIAKPGATGSQLAPTYRQQQVISLIERGLSNKEIAAALGIELTTVKNHVHHILAKLDVRRRGAVRTGLRQYEHKDRTIR
jgi:two-component system nitrate/nitrite response regulator NarL